MKTDEEYNEIAKSAAVRIARILREINDEDPLAQQQLFNVIHARVERLMRGDPTIIDGTGLVSEIAEPESADDMTAEENKI